MIKSFKCTLEVNKNRYSILIKAPDEHEARSEAVNYFYDNQLAKGEYFESQDFAITELDTA